MKLFIAIFTSLLCLLLFQSSQAATTSTQYKYEVQTGDVGTIQTTASTHSEAFRKAGNSCFDRRVALYEKHRGQISNDRMLDIVDSCANLKW